MIDVNSATWRLIEAWAVEQQHAYTERLKGDLDPIQTATVRGQLRVLDALLAKPTEKPDQYEPEVAGIPTPEV